MKRFGNLKINSVFKKKKKNCSENSKTTSKHTDSSRHRHALTQKNTKKTHPALKCDNTVSKKEKKKK